MTCEEAISQCGYLAAVLSKIAHWTGDERLTAEQAQQVAMDALNAHAKAVAGDEQALLNEPTGGEGEE